MSTTTHPGADLVDLHPDPEAVAPPRPACLEALGLVQTRPGVWVHPSAADVDFGEPPGLPPRAAPADVLPGEAPDRIRMLAFRLFDYLTRHNGCAPLDAITEAAGAAGLIGSRRTDGACTGAPDLLRAQELLPTVPAATGWAVADTLEPEASGGPPVRSWALEPID